MGGLGYGSIKGSVKDCCTLNVIQLLNFAKKIQHKINNNNAHIYFSVSCFM